VLKALPNILSGFRIAMVPVLLALAWTGSRGLFGLALAASLLSDAADGFAARRLGARSALGARLDSWGDLATWAVLAPCALWLWPDVLWQERVAVGVALASFALPTLVGWLRFGRLTSYHTWGAKAAAVSMAIGVPALLLLDAGWVFRVATAVLAVSALEEIAITARLPHWRADVPGLWAVVPRGSRPWSAASRAESPGAGAPRCRGSSGEPRPR